MIFSALRLGTPTVFGFVGIFLPYGKNIISAYWFRPYCPARRHTNLNFSVTNTKPPCAILKLFFTSFVYSLQPSCHAQQGGGGRFFRQPKFGDSLRIGVRA